MRLPAGGIIPLDCASMLTTSKSPQKYGLIVATVLLTLLIWLISKWYYQDWFANPYKYPAKAASLTATLLMCWAVVLSSRWRLLERHFGGLDKVYQVHKHIGKWAFFIILAHPLFLVLDRLPDLGRFLGFMWFQAPQGDQYLWGQNLGVAGFLLLAGLIAVTLWIRLPYHIWKRTHEWLGLVLVLIVGHIFVVQADVAAYPLLALWLYGWLVAACASFISIRFLYRFFGPRHEYVLSERERIGEILHLTFAPRGNPMDFKPSQFVYLQDAPWELKRMHPEVIRSWKSPRVSLFYVCRQAKEASFDTDIRREVESSHFHGFPAMEKRGHHYELYVSSEQGRITAETIRNRVVGDIQSKNVFLCGPGPMVDGLVEQFLGLGVPRRQIVVEDFNLV